MKILVKAAGITSKNVASKKPSLNQVVTAQRGSVIKAFPPFTHHSYVPLRLRVFIMVLRIHQLHKIFVSKLLANFRLRFGS